MPDPARSAPAPGRDLYNRSNDHVTSRDLAAALQATGADGADDRVARLRTTYAELSATYQSSKGEHGIPHA